MIFCFSISDLIHKLSKNESKAESFNNSLLENEAIPIESLKAPFPRYLIDIENEIA
jgi:hypothetical protein